jgi:cysteine desulfurase / selenocysteine lyase
MERAELGSRALFPDLKTAAYCNHGGISPPSALVKRAVARVMDDFAQFGTGAIHHRIEEREGLRAKLAKFINAENATDIGYIQNTSRGATDIALCINWKAGDRILCFEGDFPANVTPWQQAAALFKLELVFLPRPTAATLEAWVENLAKELKKPTRLCAFSTVMFQSGLRLPMERIGKLCADAGTELFADAIQAAGIAPIDVRKEQLSYLTCGGHKWMMGLEGAGFLYVSPKAAKNLEPRVAGWLGHDNALAFLFFGEGHLKHDRPLLRRASLVEGGAQSAVGYAGLEASIDVLADLGVEAIHAHVNAYLDALEPELLTRGFESERSSDHAARSGILAVRPPKGVDVVALFRAIDPMKASLTIPDGRLRFAPHWPNHRDEVKTVLAAVDAGLAAVKA